MPQISPRMSIAAFALCSLAASSLAGGCSRNNSEVVPQAAPLAPGSDTSNASMPQDSLSREGAPLVRKAVREFISERHPNAEIEGVWSVAFTPNYCIAAADIKTEARRRTIEVIVRQFTREDGTDYWRVEGLRPDSASARVLAPRTNSEILDVPQTEAQAE